jgi:recombination protein RecR
MYPAPIEKLIGEFQKLPGIGPKQAAKFAFRMLRMSEAEVHSFASSLSNIKKVTSVCTQCGLTFERDSQALCFICRNPARDKRLVAVVETDRDAYTIEKAGAFEGVYHVLGTHVSLAADSLDSPTLRKLARRLSSLEVPEVILAMNATVDGGEASLFLERALRPLGVPITRLGRGLSSGIEIEYADKETLHDAFKNRK